MASEWFYTTNKQQMGPVTWSELRELADGGILKPHDMVWTEGMDEWVKAINQNGLFADDDADGAVTTKTKKKSSYTDAKPPPGRRSKRTEEDEDEEDEKEEKRKRRKSEQDRTKMAVGVKVGLILGGVLLVLLFLGCTGGLLLWWGVGGGGRAGDGARTQSYTIRNLQPGAANVRTFNFQQGSTVTIVVHSNVNHRDADVDVLVIRGPGNRDIIASDLRKEAACRVDFRVPANDNYRVEVQNSGRIFVPNCRVEITER